MGAEAKKYAPFKWACSVSDYYHRGYQKRKNFSVLLVSKSLEARNDLMMTKSR